MIILTKPFSPRDFLARINAALRREREYASGELPTSIRRDGIILNLVANEVSLPDRTIRLSPTETRLLYFLIKDYGEIVKSSELCQKVWGSGIGIELLMTYIHRLRLRLGDDPPRLIVNVSGDGYRMASGKTG